MSKKGSAVWKGSIKEGQGTISTQTGVLQDAPYSFSTRFGEAKGTNPEELIAAAHAACFSMALSLMLGEAGFTPESLATEAAVNIESKEGGFEITSSRLTLKAKVPGIDKARFEEVANQAKEGCPVSKVLNAKITLDFTLEH